MTASPLPSSSASFSLVARDLARTYGTFTVLDGVDVSVGPRTRLGVVGPNGVGKTTLLRVLAGREHPDRGRVVRTPPTARVGYLPQEPERNEREPLRAFLARRTGVAGTEAELERAAGALATGTPGVDDAYSAALDAFLAAGGADFDARMHTVAADLGIPDTLLDSPTAALSGGQAARASLAAILLSRYDVFLLDEPTNDLDFDGLARLERFLDELPGGVVLVSHDRAFLEHAVTRVLELDEHSRRGTEYGGGWQGYLDARATARRHAEEGYATYAAERARLESRMRSQRQWAVQGVTREKRAPRDSDKAQRDFRVNRTEKQASKTRATERALSRLEAVEKPWEGWDLRYQMAEAPRSGAVVIRLAGAVVRRGTFRLGLVDLEVGWQERIAIVGPNGSGKTTLLRALLGSLPLDAGERTIGPGVIIGEMDQARAAFSTSASLLDSFLAATGLMVPDARSLLAKFGLGAEHVMRASATLSPGERTRAVMARFAAQGVNCLVLDEPTNHLDLPAIEQLELALDAFAGTLLLVTHDRRLLDAVRITRTIDAHGRDQARLEMEASEAEQRARQETRPSEAERSEA
jgi:ATPase subunit of ABC transporter with duplicated ATPase domains